MSLWLLALAVLGPAGPAEGSPAGIASTGTRTETAPDGTFSITFPSSWRAVPTSSGDYVQLALFADGPLEISIVVGSRPLGDAERALDRHQLLDQMIERTMINTVEVGNTILQVGRVEPLAEDWPAFAAVATNRDRSKMITVLRSFDGERAYVVTTLTDNLQGSPELGATVSGVVESFTLHRAGPASEPNAEPPVHPRPCDCW